MMIQLALGNNMSLFDLTDEWHTIVPPALAIILFCGGFYLVGRTIDEVTNPRLKAR
jgi:ABC-type dipeptide/oligopeptide/nickel transport system permease subunit